MNSKPIRIPGPDHPITITPTKGRVTVVVNGKRIAVAPKISQLLSRLGMVMLELCEGDPLLIEIQGE